MIWLAKLGIGIERKYLEIRCGIVPSPYFGGLRKQKFIESL
jgi:hypothetical protein